MRAAGAGLFRRHRIKCLDEARIESCPQADGLGKAGRPDGRVTVQAFLMKEHRDTEPRMFDEKLLDRIGQLRRLARTLAHAGVGWLAAGVTRAGDLADAMAVPEMFYGLGKIKIAVLVLQFGGFLLPDAHHLRDFLRQGHAGQQVGNAPGERGGRIFVGGNFSGDFFLHATLPHGTGKKFPTPSAMRFLVSMANPWRIP